MKRMMVLGLMISLLTGHGLWAAAARGKDPIAIPFSSTAPSGRRFVEKEWSQAAVLRNFFKAPGGADKALDVPTALYLMHDGSNLWVGATCSDPGFPDHGQAVPRGPEEDLTLDESIQVVLGIGGAAQPTIEFGGYDGAHNTKMSAVAHYYEFTVNACGSVSRTYDETPLQAPQFSATASISSNQGWQAVMKIPLASIGIKNAITGRMLHFNAFRFYRGVRYGLYLPGFGGYTRMPFLAGAFLSQTDSAKRTVQEPLPPKQAAEPKPKGKRVFKFYAMSRKLIATFAASDAAASIRLTVIDGPTQTTTVPPGDEGFAEMVLPVDRAGTPFDATVELIDADGNVLAHEKKTFPFPPAPDWLGTDAGQDYVTNRVPRQWVAPVVAGDKVKLGHGEFTFDGQAVPSAVTVREKSVLASPVRIVAEANGATLTSGAVQTTTQEPTRVILESSPDAAMQVRTVVDYDGFMVVKVRFPGLDARQLSKMELHVPLVRDVPKFVNRGHLQDTATLGSGGYVGPKGGIWVGSADAGMFFSLDTPCFFSDSAEAVQLAVGPASPPELIIRFVDAVDQVPSADHVFQFFLLPTPTRKTMPPAMHNKMALWFEQWSDYESYPDLKKMPEVKKRAAAAHADGKQFYLYFHMELAENAPGFADYRNDWLIPPGTSWYKRAYDNKNPPHGEEGHVHCKGVPCWLGCLRGPVQDLFLDGMRELVREGGVDGFYLDGPSYPFGCNNLSHDGCGRHRATWDDDATQGIILGQRTFIKRMRGLCDEAGKDFSLWPHCGGGLELSTLSLCDFYYEGEQLFRYPSGYRLPLDKFLVGYSGVPFGFRGIFLPQIYGWGKGGAEALTYSLVHGTEAAGVKSPLQDKVFSLGARASGAKFYPYWEPRPHITATGGDLPFSYWLTSSNAVLVVANAGYNGDQHMTFDAAGLFPGQALGVTLLNIGASVPVTKGRFISAVPEDAVRAYVVTPMKPGAGVEITDSDLEAAKLPEPAATPFTPIHTFCEKDWQISGGSVGTNGWPIYITSRPGGAAATARLLPVLPAECTVKLRIMPSGRRLSIKLGGLTLTHDSGWSFAGLNKMDVDVRLHDRATPFVAGDPAVLEMGFKDSRLNVYWNGQPLLTRALPENPTASKKLQLSTWAGDQLGIDVIAID